MDFVSNIRSGLRTNKVIAEHFLMTVKHNYDRNIPNFDNTDAILTYLVNSLDYNNCELLYEIVEIYGDNDMRKSMKEYKQHKESYMFGALLIDVVAINNMLSDAFVRGRSSTLCKRQSKEYRNLLSIALSTYVSISSLNYVESWWKRLSYLNLPKVGVILDSIVAGGGIRVTPEEQSYSAVSVYRQVYLDSCISLHHDSLYFIACISLHHDSLYRRSYWQNVAVGQLTLKW